MTTHRREYISREPICILMQQDTAIAQHGSIATDSNHNEAIETAVPALKLTNLSKRFGTGDDAIVAVDDVNLTIEPGSIVGLLGPNGAGKTTLIKCALGIIIPDSGSVSVFGNRVDGTRRSAYRDVDAMLEGARNDYWRLTVRENLRYFATIHGIDPNSVTQQHDRLLDRLELTDKADTPVRDLSRGMKQKVSLASVLAGGASLVFLDEPTLGLDVESSRTLQQELRRLAHEDGRTIVLSSHNMDVIERVCDRVVMMANGRIVADDSVNELLSDATRDTVQITSADIDDRLVETLIDRFSVTVVGETAAGRTTIEITHAGERLYDVLDVLRNEAVTIDDIRTVQPQLEEVFVNLTGMESEQTATSGRAE